MTVTILRKIERRKFPTNTQESVGYRPIINLKEVESGGGTETFQDGRYWDFERASKRYREGDNFCKINLKDAYLTTSLHPDDQEFRQFRWRGKSYPFFCLYALAFVGLMDVHQNIEACSRLFA
jgi:hypothetical protein